MTIAQKIESAEQRIKELDILIRHWKASEASSQHVALEIIQGCVIDDYELDDYMSRVA
ncbi:MAG: hypothetical protein AB8A41_07470 [Prochlorococcus sp.]|jgi:hypothetical protein